MARQPQRFTVYDMMEAKGMFEINSANVGAKDQDGQNLYKGPVEFPKMLYHPEGKTRVIVPGVAENTPFGPQMRGEQREIISQLANSKAEETKLLADGWHLHPAHAMEAAGLEPPPTSSAQQIEDLQAQIKKLQLERDKALALSGGKIQAKVGT